MAEQDQELVGRARSGDTDALTSLLRAHGPSVQSSLEIDRKWRSVLDVEDVMQVTYLEAFLRIDRLTGNDVKSFVAWLDTIARNNLRDAVRALNTQKRPNPDRRVTSKQEEDSAIALLEELAVTTSTPSRKVHREEAKQFLQRAIDRLPESYQEVVRRYELEGQPAAEVAKAMGKSRGAVFMIRARARERLAQLLGPISLYLNLSE